MTDAIWDLKFAIRLAELNARLTQPGGLPTGTPITSQCKFPEIAMTATLKAAQILEVLPGAPRVPGPIATLAIQMDLVNIEASGSGLAKLITVVAGGKDATLQVPALTVFFNLSLRFVKMQNTGTKLVFDKLPENQQGAPVLTAKIPQDSPLNATERMLFQTLLDVWLTEHLDDLSPVFALFGEGGWSLGTLNYAHVQAPNEGDDLLCVYAMLSSTSGPAPGVEPLLPEFVEDGKAAFLLSTSALLGTALLPAMNAYAKSIDGGTYNAANGKVFVLDAANQKLTLAVPQLYTGTVTNESNDSPLDITAFDLRYGNFGGTEALQLEVQQSAVLIQSKYYSQGGPGGGVSHAIKVPWCTIYRQQSDILDVTVSGPQGQQVIDLVPRSGQSVDKSWSTPADSNTGIPALDIVIGILKGASDCLALFLGPPGLALFLVKLAITTIGQEVDLTNMQNAKDRTKPIAPGSIMSAIAFEWGGIGDLKYASAKLSGGLKIIGS
jgi:hypothetical protein